MLHFGWRVVLSLGLVLQLIISACQPISPSSPRPAPQYKFTKIADSTMQIRDREDTFTAFGGSFDNGPSVSDGIVVFNSQGQNNYHAIFRYSNGNLDMVADTETMVPGKNLPFTYFGHPSTIGDSIT